MKNNNSKLKILAVCAHPDDADLCFGGTGLKLSKLGHDVHFLSVSDGCCGHQTMAKEELAQRRKNECLASAEISGIKYDVLGIHDTEVCADLETRKKLVGYIRRFSPDIIVTNRPCDYHPDHRATALLVQDASYLLKVPHFCEDVPAMQNMPVILFFSDEFHYPTPFKADIAVDVTEEQEGKLRMIACHESQFLEWMPFVEGKEYPRQGEATLEYIKRVWGYMLRQNPSESEEVLKEHYGENIKNITSAEGFEICEYGRIVSKKELYDMLGV